MNSQVFSKTKRRKVFFDQDANPEDLVALMMLLSMENIEIIGISITPADCFMDDAIEATLKILSLYERDIPVAEGHIHGKNAFPNDFRILTLRVNNLPIMLLQPMKKELLVEEAGHEFMARKIKESKEPVTVLLTGPCTNLVAALEKDPEIKNNIEEVVWMAGAIDVPGNVVAFHHDRTAEWNVYWDPKSSKKLLDYGLNITMFSLDATNTVPVDKNFLKRIANQRRYNVSELVGQFYALTYQESPTEEDNYFMWDTLCTAYLGCDELATFRKIEIDISVKSPSEGRTFKSPGNGKWVNVADNINKEKFYKYFLDCLKKNGKTYEEETP